MTNIQISEKIHEKLVLAQAQMKIDLENIRITIPLTINRLVDFYNNNRELFKEQSEE